MRCCDGGEIDGSDGLEEFAAVEDAYGIACNEPSKTVTCDREASYFAATAFDLLYSVVDLCRKSIPSVNEVET